jgi:hypothetical protein
VLHLDGAFQASSPKLFKPGLVPGFFLPGTNPSHAGLFLAQRRLIAAPWAFLIHARSDACLIAFGFPCS